ncbi:multidrug resistance [Fusarium acutatum]|uniref:Multidrug resistance n=1 Tax=Fusarium acutatum TaxID=78861 RepID=A0A8H4JQE5_9HYPO|nr:multidrug resistance [Fusarium acutatum]
MTRINATETTPLIPEIPPEVSDVERSSPEEPKTYSHAFIARVVVALLIVGCCSALVGTGQTLWQVILGRVISGSGGAGMTTMASVIITELAPLREVASWQSYMNVIATVGRSIGGPLGGFLADTIGWRWSFLGQSPIFAVSMIIAAILLPSTTQTEGATLERIKRIDALGALLLGGSVLAFMVPLEIGGQKIPWSHPLVPILAAAGVILSVAFVLIESRWAKEPIFPLRLLRSGDVTKTYLIAFGQAAAQLGMMYTVPIYFQVTQRVSSTVAGAHLFPAVIGNTVGGIATGLIIKRTGRYKALIVFSAVSSITSYALMLLRWHGQNNWLESLYVFPGGLGMGIAQSAAFIALQASIDPKDKAAASSGIFLAVTLGSVVGMAGTSAAIQGFLRHDIQQNLSGLGTSQHFIDEVIQKAAESVSYIDEASEPIRRVLIEGYIKGIEYGHGLSIVFSGITLITALLLKEPYTQHYTISRLQSYSTPQGRGRTSDDPSSKLLVSHNLSEVENQRTSYPSVVKYQDIRPVPTLPTTYYTSNKDNWTPLSQDDVSITGTITLTNKMSYEQTSLMASNLDQTNQAPRTEANMTPEQERNTRIMACDIQRFYEYVQREKHVFRRWFSYYGINLATFLEPYCTLFKNERKWPEAWFDNEHELVNGLKTFQHMAKQLLQQWKQDVAAQILSVRNTALSRLFTAEDVSLAAKLEPNPLEGKAASLERAQSELAFDKTLSKFRFLADEMLQGMEGGPTIERPGHPWTRMEGFDVLNLMIKMQRILTMNTRRKTCSSMRLYPSMGFTRDEQALSVHGGEPVL